MLRAEGAPSEHMRTGLAGGPIAAERPALELHSLTTVRSMHH